MNCKNCNAAMQIDTQRKLLICPYCNSVEPFDHASKEEIQELLKKALSEANQENRKMIEKMIAEHQRKMAVVKTGNTAMNVTLFVTLGIALTITLIMTMFGLTTEYKASGVVALIQTVLFLLAIIFRAAGARNPKKAITGNIFMIAGLLLVIPWFISLTVTSDDSSKKTYMDEIYARDYYWPDEGYAKVVPRWRDQPDYAYVGDRNFDATILNATDEIFAEYVKKCKEEGFNVDVTETDTTFNAYNEEGAELNLDYLRGADPSVIYLDLYKPLEFIEMTWPAQGMMKDVPSPRGDGELVQMMVVSMSTDFFEAYVNDVSAERFVGYVQECMEAGFEGRYESGSKKYYGSKGEVSISLESKRDKVLLITIH